jgi:hypothetical protein
MQSIVFEGIPAFFRYVFILGRIYRNGRNKKRTSEGKCKFSLSVQGFKDSSVWNYEMKRGNK